jgi:hypothetical protein
MHGTGGIHHASVKKEKAKKVLQNTNMAPKDKRHTTKM